MFSYTNFHWSILRYRVDINILIWSFENRIQFEIFTKHDVCNEMKLTKQKLTHPTLFWAQAKKLQIYNAGPTSKFYKATLPTLCQSFILMTHAV